METIVLLLIFGLIVAGVFWILRKNESLSCKACEDHSHLAPYKIEAPVVEQSPSVTTSLPKPARQKPAKMQPGKKDVATPTTQQPQKKQAPASKTAPVKQPARAPRAKKSNNQI